MQSKRGKAGAPADQPRDILVHSETLRDRPRTEHGKKRETKVGEAAKMGEAGEAGEAGKACKARSVGRGVQGGPTQEERRLQTWCTASLKSRLVSCLTLFSSAAPLPL